MSKLRKKIELSDLLALIALIVSVASIYFSIFYKNRDLTLSLIDSKVETRENKLNVKLLYHNRGNTFSTVITDYLIFYQTEDWQNEGIIFNDREQVFNVDYNPVVLLPGEQILRDISIEVDFNNIFYGSDKIDLKKNILVGVVTTYINEKGLRTNDMFPLGHIQLDENKEINKYKLLYNVFELNGEHYYISTEIK